MAVHFGINIFFPTTRLVKTWGRFHKLIYALRQTICTLLPTSEKLFTGAKVWRKVQKIGVGGNKTKCQEPSL